MAIAEFVRRQTQRLTQPFAQETDPRRRRILQAAVGGSITAGLFLIPRPLHSQELDPVEQYKDQLALCDGYVNAHDAGDSEEKLLAARNTLGVHAIETNVCYFPPNPFLDIEEGLYAVHDRDKLLTCSAAQIQRRKLENALSQLPLDSTWLLDVKFSLSDTRAFSLLYDTVIPYVDSQKIAFSTDQGADPAYKLIDMFGSSVTTTVTVKTDYGMKDFMENHFPKLSNIENVGISTKYKLVTEEKCDEWRASNMQVFVWTFDHDAEVLIAVAKSAKIFRDPAFPQAQWIKKPIFTIENQKMWPIIGSKVPINLI